MPEEKEIKVRPTMDGYMEHLKDELLMLFGYSWNNGKRYRLFYGVGIVYRIVKGDKYDFVLMNFGLFKGKKLRKIVIFENHARRQLLTLKKGQMAQVVGICRYGVIDIELKGKPALGQKLFLYGKALQGWYVPTMLDIRRLPINEDLVEPTEKEEKEMEQYEDILEEFMNGKGEEE